MRQGGLTLEHWESLGPGGLRFAWDDALFPPGTDAFALAGLPRLRPGLRVCDLGCGTGLLGFLLMQRERALFLTGIDIDPRATDLGRRCAAENAIEDRAVFLQGDLRQVEALLPGGGFDLAVCNPPYYPAGSGRLPRRASQAQGRSEVSLCLAQACKAAAYLLRWGGRVCIVHKPQRLTDLLVQMRCAGLEPKRLRTVHPRPGAAPCLVLAEGRRGGRSGLTVEPPLLLKRSDGTPTPEAEALYFRTPPPEKSPCGGAVPPELWG